MGEFKFASKRLLFGGGSSWHHQHRDVEARRFEGKLWSTAFPTHPAMLVHINNCIGNDIFGRIRNSQMNLWTFEKGGHSV